MELNICLQKSMKHHCFPFCNCNCKKEFNLEDINNQIQSVEKDIKSQNEIIAKHEELLKQAETAVSSAEYEFELEAEKEFNFGIIIAIAAVLLMIMAFVTTPMAVELIQSLKKYIALDNSNLTPRWWMGIMENWDEVKKHNIQYFMYRFYLARNLCVYFLIISAVCYALSNYYTLGQ